MAWNAEFQWDDLRGTITVACIPNDDPGGYGTVGGAAAYGFPVCTATVDYPRRGYRSMFGWVQLVRSTDDASGGEQFEPDPFALFGDAHSPYCFYGTEPILFDSPSRLARAPLAWLSYSFLATTPVDEVLAGNPRRVVPLVGFSWGFEVREDDSVALREVGALTTADWEAVVPVLRRQYPSPLWTFADSM